jgi:hypothetical protein
LTDGLTVYVPTYRRATPAQQVTLKSLSGTVLAERGGVVLVAHPDEVRALSAMGWPVLECPVQGRIGAVRQWILDTHDVEVLGPRVYMLDDDLTFFALRLDEPAKFRTLAGPHEVDTILDRVAALLRQVPVAGITSRSGGNRLDPPTKSNTRTPGSIGLNVPWVRRLGARFDRVTLQEDFDFLLQVLRSGHRVEVLTTHCAEAGQSNAEGGCSTERDAERQAAAAHRLKELHPGFVTVVEKEAKSWGQGMTTRTDVRIQWAKAHQSGVELLDLLGEDVPPDPDWDGLAPEWDLL